MTATTVSDRDILVELLIALEAVTEQGTDSPEHEAAVEAIARAKDHISQQSEPTKDA